MKITKKITLGSIPAIFAIPLTMVSCSPNFNGDVVTMAQKAASSMNFIKYKDSASIAAPTIYPLINRMPFSSLVHRYQLLQLRMRDENGTVMTNRGLTYGAMEPDSEGDSYLLDQSGRNITILLRNNLKWSNGDKLVAENWVDTIKAMLDLNNASEYVYDIQRIGIKNSDEAYSSQENFLKTYKYIYDDPFNYKNKPIAPTDNDFVNNKDKYFPRILIPCLNIGIESDGDNKLLLHFNHKETVSFISSLESPIFWPINKKFMDLHGGIEGFGKSKDSMISSGAYKTTFFDGKYGVEFDKNFKFHREEQVVTPNIVFRFMANENTRETAYKDHLILSTTVNRDFLPTYQSDEELRHRLKRVGGIGTIGMFLNSFSGRSNYKALNNINFRKALEYGIDRSSFLTAINLDFSIPVGVYTASASYTPDGNPYLIELENKKYNLVTPDGHEYKDKSFLNMPIESRSYSFNHDNIPRVDHIFNKEIARKFLDAAKRELGPENFPIKLSYPYSTADEMGKSINVILKSFFKESFGGDVILEGRALPNLVYQSMISSGDWDIQFKQVDPLTHRPWDYLGEFVLPDAPDKANGKTVGYLKNNAGDYTYSKYFSSINEQAEKDLIRNFNIDPFEYDIAKWFSTYPSDITDKTDEFSNYNLRKLITKWEPIISGKPDSGHTTIQKNLINEIIDFEASTFMPLMTEAESATSAKEKKMIFNKMMHAKSSFVEATLPTSISYSTIYQTLEKIQRDMIPVIPIAEADSKWMVSRMGGSKTSPQGHLVNPMFVYDMDNRPFTYLEREPE